MADQLAEPADYWAKSSEPLQVLLFLLPLLALYELGAWWCLAGTDVLLARAALRYFFEAFGVTGYYLPGLIVVVILGAWHLVAHAEVRFEPPMYLLMWVESCLLALPLMAMAVLMVMYVPVAAEAEPVSASAWGGFGEAPAWAVGLTVSVGAGIYEELLFRLILLTLLHIAFVDVIPLPAWAGTGVAVLASAVAFAQVHFDPVAAAPFQLGRWLFFVLAGVYLGYVFLFRGFGLAVGAHAMYDVMVVGLQMMQPHAE